jgi:signal recognition particle subunit SRP54
MMKQFKGGKMARMLGGMAAKGMGGMFKRWFVDLGIAG